MIAQLLTASATPVVAAADSAFLQSDELTAAGGYGREFGKSIAIDGDTMVVGAQEGDHVRANGVCGQGAAYVFSRSASPLWQLVARLLPSRLPCSDEFGASVAISGDWIAVGDPHDNVAPDGDPEGLNYRQGGVYLYQKPSGGWQDATETQWLTEFDGSPVGISPDFDDGFGASVRLHGTTLFVGAPGWDAKGVQTGALFVYENPIDAGWEKAAELTPSSPILRGRFGGGIAYSDGTLLVGNTENDYGWAYGAYASAPAYIYEEPVDGWATTDHETARLELGPSVFSAVALDGGTAIVADAYLQQAVVFTEPLGGWVTTAQPSAVLVPGSIQSGRFPGLYGAEVEVDDDLAIVTAPFNFTDPTNDRKGGEAWVFRRPASGWGSPEDVITVDAETSLRDDSVNGTLGWSVAMHDDLVAIGDIGADHFQPDTGQPNASAGSVFIYRETADHAAPTTTIARTPAVASGSNGWDNGPVTLTVAADDGPDGSGIVEIRCQIDTALPNPTFDDLPTGPCPFADADGDVYRTNGFHTLFAASVDGVGNRSAMTSQAFQIDTRVPTTYITLSPAQPDREDGTYGVPVDVHLDYSDGTDGSGRDIVRCVLDPAQAPSSFDDMPTTLCGTDFFLGTGRRFESGTHTIWIAAQDRAGNVSIPMSRSFTIDRAPTATITLTPSSPDGSNGWWRNPVRVLVAGAAAASGSTPSVRCSLDPAVAPASFDQLPATCPYLGSGGLVGGDGQHTVYAAAQDTAGTTSAIVSSDFRIDRTPPAVTCDGAGPADFTIGEPAGTVTANVSDQGSGPAAETASTELTAANLGSVGNRTVQVTGTDLAGNEGAANCAYVVGYDVDIASPQPGAVFSAGTTVTVTFGLLDATGTPISDARAAVLAGGRKSPCYIDALFDGVSQRACPTYAAATDVFTLKVKTPKGKNVYGLHDIAIQVRDPGGTGVIDLVRLVIQLAR